MNAGADEVRRRVLKVGFVPGVTPDRWARAWRARPSAAALELVPTASDDAEPAVREGRLDMAFVRLPVRRDQLHVVVLYREVPVVVAGRDHPVAAYDEIALADLADEPLHPPGDPRVAIEAVAAGTGVVVLPMSVARLHHRRDVVAVRVTDLPETEVGLVWLVERDDDTTQDFVGVVRGRTARSSR